MIILVPEGNREHKWICREGCPSTKSRSSHSRKVWDFHRKRQRITYSCCLTQEDTVAMLSRRREVIPMIITWKGLELSEETQEEDQENKRSWRTSEASRDTRRRARSLSFPQIRVLLFIQNFIASLILYCIILCLFWVLLCMSMMMMTSLRLVLLSFFVTLLASQLNEW